jgi:N-methylhydantoinase B
MPLLIERYALRPDSMGAGQFRGGAGIELEVKIFPPNASVASRAMERYHFRPWGRRGGGSAATGYTRLNPETADQREIGKIDVLHLEPGDVIRVGTQGGGGYGNPLDRDPERVLADVRAGVVTVAGARRDYGVVTDGTTIDRAATAARRAELEAGRRADPVRDFDYGPERDAYESLWSDPVRTALVRALQQYPGRLQRFLMDRVSRLLEESARQGLAIGPETVPGLISAALAGLRR